MQVTTLCIVWINNCKMRLFVLSVAVSQDFVSDQDEVMCMSMCNDSPFSSGLRQIVSVVCWFCKEQKAENQLKRKTLTSLSPKLVEKGPIAHNLWHSLALDQKGRVSLLFLERKTSSVLAVFLNAPHKHVYFCSGGRSIETAPLHSKISMCSQNFMTGMFFEILEKRSNCTEATCVLSEELTFNEHPSFQN